MGHLARGTSSLDACRLFDLDPATKSLFMLYHFHFLPKNHLLPMYMLLGEYMLEWRR